MAQKGQLPAAPEAQVVQSFAPSGPQALYACSGMRTPKICIFCCGEAEAKLCFEAAAQSAKVR